MDETVDVMTTSVEQTAPIVTEVVKTVAKSGGNTKSALIGAAGAGAVVAVCVGYHFGKKWWDRRQLTRLQQAAERASAGERENVVEILKCKESGDEAA